MLTIRNKRIQARAIDFCRDYPGVGRSVFLRPHSSVDVPDEAVEEKALTRLASRGIVEITRTAPAAPPETKPERRPRRAAETKSEREE